MKNVLSFATVIIALIIAACSVEATQEPATRPATATLQPFPSRTPSPLQPVPPDQATSLQSSDPTATPFVHVVREGDTLLSIAIRYGVGLEELVLVNPGIDPQFLSVGASLRIPGPEGQAVDVLLPTPTPVAISPTAVHCFHALTGEFRCIASIENNLSFSIEAISGIIGLYDDQRALITQKSVDSLLRFLPPERRMPLAATFNQKPADFAYAQVELLSAIQVNPTVSRSVPLEAELIDWQLVSKGGAIVTVEINLPTDLDEQAYNIRLLGIASDGERKVAGYRLIEEVIDPTSTEAVEIEFYILSLGPPIRDIEVIAELLRLD